ncbi:MAG: alpha/beta fold hydrolase [Chloroflexi bacterium]|nr:alpha/beta fold hydrolase [Chloroflexota bacterium]
MTQNHKFSYMPGGEPFFFRGGPIGCLLLHGFTGAPREVFRLGEYLAGQGHTVLGARLAGHGTTPDDLRRLHWRDWLGSAVDGLKLLRDQCKQVFVLGLSMGGMTAINLAAQYPEQVAGIVTMSTPLKVQTDWRMNFANLIALFQPYIKKEPADPAELARLVEHVSYAAWTTTALKQFANYLRVTDEALPRVAAPALLIHSKGDTFILPHNLPYIYEHIGSKDKEMLWLEQSGHIVTEDLERHILFERAAAFINKHVA